MNIFRIATAKISSLYIYRSTIGERFDLYRRLPKNYSEADYEYFERELKKSFEPVKSVYIKKAYLTVREALVTKFFNIVDESLISEEFRGHYGLTYLFKPLLKSRKLEKGNYLVIHNHYGVGYGHWLVDVLPRLFVIREQLKKFKIILPSNYNTFHLKTLVPFSISSNDIQYVDENEIYEVPNITIISHIGTSCNTKDEILQQMRSFYLDFYCGETKVVPFRKIFISRANMNNRRIVNEAEVEEMVIENGFEIFHPQDYSFEEQVKIFAECKVMMGLTGSGLTNMLFMPANGSVIEFKMENDFHNLHYFSMSSGMQLDYYYLLCKTIGDDRFTADFVIDVNKLENILKSIN